MLRIHSEITASPVTVAGKDVAGLIPGLRLATNRQRQFQRKNDEKRNSRCGKKRNSRCGKKPVAGTVRKFHGREVYLMHRRKRSRYVSYRPESVRLITKDEYLVWKLSTRVGSECRANCCL